jgi:tripartite-type tricarboxylate transporter receptor subunit TctC
MNTLTRRAFVAASLAASASFTMAASYPTRPVVLVVPFAAGGFTSSAARLIAERLGERLGQPIIVENRAGAGGALATDYVAKAKADGYTLLFGSRVTQVTNPLVNKTRVPTRADFAPIAAVCDVSAVIVANPARPYKTIAELVAYAKANPDKVNFATPGNGTASHLAAAVFMDLTHTRMTHVPYRGSATALQDLLGGNVDIAFDYPSSTSAFVKAGTLRALATLGTERVSSLPDVPTIAEAGVPGAEMASWQAILAPGQTPTPIVDRLVAEIARVMEEPETRKKLVDLGTTPMFVGGKDLQLMIEKETVKWRDVVSRARISAD